MSGMGRREFITLLGGAAAWPLAARAQQEARIYTIGVLTLSSPNPEQLLQAFVRAFVMRDTSRAAIFAWRYARLRVGMISNWKRRPSWSTSRSTSSSHSSHRPRWRRKTLRATFR